MTNESVPLVNRKYVIDQRVQGRVSIQVVCSLGVADIKRKV